MGLGKLVKGHQYNKSFRQYKTGEDNERWGMKHKKLKCPYCMKLIPVHVFNRWHNESCKERFEKKYHIEREGIEIL